MAIPTHALLQTYLPLIAFLYFAYKALTTKKRLPYPPGPKGLPIIGNVYDVPQGSEWVTFKELADNHSTSMTRGQRIRHSNPFNLDTDVLYLNSFGRSTVVINSLEAAQEIFERRSAIYSERYALRVFYRYPGSYTEAYRPRFTMLNEL